MTTPGPTLLTSAPGAALTIRGGPLGPMAIRVPRGMPAASGVGSTDDLLAAVVQLNPDLQFEVDREGALIVMSPTGARSGAMNAEISRQLGNWARADGTGVTFDSSTLFRMPRTETRRSPDASWMRRDRYAALPVEGPLQILTACPDLVLELRSPTDELEALQAKLQEYLENGARLGLLLDPSTRSVWVYREGHAEPEVLREPSTVTGEPVLPGLVLDLVEVWRAGGYA